MFHINLHLHFSSVSVGRLFSLLFHIVLSRICCHHFSPFQCLLHLQTDREYKGLRVANQNISSCVTLECSDFLEEHERVLEDAGSQED